MMGPQTNEPLKAANYPPGGYGPPPGGGGYGPPPGAPPGGSYPPGPPGGYAPPPPPGGYGGPPGSPVQAQPPGAPGAAPPPAKSGGKGGLIIALVVGVLALGGGAAAAWWFWLRSTGPELAVYMPKDTQVYVEIPSVTKALVSFVGVDPIDDKELDPEKYKGEIVDGFASSFDVSKDEAEAFFKSTKSIAVGGRDLKEDGQGGVLIAFSSKGDVEPILGSKRFDKDGDLAGGTKYKLYRRDVEDADKLEKMSTYEKAFNDMGSRKSKDDKDDDDDKKKKSACVWWEGKAMLGCGDVEFIEDVGKVISGDKESLAKANETFAQAKWPAGSALLVYFDPEAIDEKDVKKDFFDGTGPVLGSARFSDAGLIMSVRAELKGKKLPDDKVYGKPADLTLYERLPADTFAYVAFSTKTEASYKDFEKDLIKSLEEADEKAGEKFEKGLEEMEKNLGFTLEDIYKAAGDEAILAVTATEKVDLETVMKKDKEALDYFGLVFAMHVKDKDAAEKVIKGLRETAEDKAKGIVEVDKKDGGFTVKAKEGDFPEGSLTLVEDKYLVLAAGNKKRIDAILGAFGKEGDTLKADKAHAKAQKALAGKNALFLWVDTGRIARLALKMDEDIKKKMKKEGFPIDALVLEGDDRLTGALAVRVEVKEGLWTVEAEDLNGLLGSVGAGAAGFALRGLGGGGGGIPKPDDGDDGGGSGSGSGGGSSSLPSDIAVVGVAACDDYIKKTWACAEKLGGQTGTSLKDSLKKSAEAWKQAAAHPAARGALEDGCKKASEAMKSLCP